MAWQPPEDELDSNVLQQPKFSEDELVKNIPDQWSPPKAELVENIPDQWSPPEDELDNSPTKIKDVGTLQQMKQSGQELTREQERVLFDAEDKKDINQKASEAITTFVPTGIEIAKQLGTGAGEFLYKGILKPIDAMSQSPEEAEKTLKEAKNTWRSGVSGVAGDIQETSDALVRFSMFGSSITDKLLGKSNDERFEKYMLREGMRQFAQKVYADDPDNAARLLAENPLLQKLASAAALAQGATPEEAELAKKAYEELVKEQGLTKDEINENVSMLGEIISPISLPGTNRITNTFAKATSKVTRKAGELALKGVVAPLAKGVAKTAGGLESGIEKIQGASRKIGEYAVGDPDTFVKTATNTIVGPAKLPAKMTRGIATTIADVASQAGQGRRGMFELAGRAATSGELTKKLFGPQAMGGKGRARVADWAVRQSNAIIQPAVNGAVLNVALGLPDIETARDLGYSAGVGAGIGAYGGARLAERAGALIDPTTGLSEKIDAIVTPDPSQLRKDEDADIQRFIKTADPTLMSSIDELSNVNNIKSALDLKIKNLEAKKVAQINKDDERRIQDQIDNFAEQRKALDKSTPQTEAEIKRQVQLSFTDAMDLAKTTGAAAGLNNIQVKVLRPDQMEDFYRNLYGKTLTDAESVVQQLVGNPRLSPSEKEMLGLADQTIKQYLQDVAGSSTARGFAISEQTGKPNHLKMQNQTGATVVINGDLVTQMGRDGLNLGRVINHEMQHALSNFQEVRDMIAPIRKELFDQKVINPDGTFEVVKKGVIPDSELDKFALQYAAAMDAFGGASFLSNFANQDQLRNYMKEEYLSELAGLSGGIQGNLRSNLDSVGRSVVDWIESRTKNGALKRVKEALRNYGVIVDDQGQFSSVIGGELNPEALAMMRQYQRGLRDLNESLVYNSDPVKDEAEIPLTVFSTNRALQQRYKDSEFFEQQQVVKMTTPDGQTQEIVVPPNVKVDSFISDYRFANGELVDELGNVISLGPDIPLQAMPDGTSLSVDTRIARNADGSPRIISPRESKRRAKKRGEAIRKAIDEAPEDASGVRLEDTGNGNYRGTLSPTQVAAINALPNDLVAPSLKRKIAFFNEILGRKDGSIVDIEYQAAIRDKKYRALQPQMRTEIPFGFQFDKQGNFLMTTMSMSRMHDKANAWAAKRPRNLRLWGGDMTKFWDSVRQYLYNHKQGLQGHIGLNPDPEIAMEMKNRINDLFNVYRKETRDANPERTTLPKRKGQDSRDVVIRSRRMDRINSYDETALAKMPFSYELAVKNYLPAENPLAELQSPEQFAQAMEIDTELARLAAQGNIEPLELQLHQQDLLHPAEYIDVENGKLRVRSMFDPTQAILEPMESEPDVSASATQFMPAVTERYPTSERGFYSGLQKTIDEKVQGKFASPEQLKAIVNNPQNVKAEELKWSNVLGEIDRLAAENSGKVPKDKVMDYLRNEGAVKFEEVTLGQDNSIQKIADEYRIKIEDEYGEKAFYDEFDEPIEFDELPIRLQDAIDQGRNVLEPKHSTYQLPGGTNYREVVMTMPFDLSSSQTKIDAINNRRKEILNTAKEQDLFKRSQTDPEAKALNDSLTAEFVDLGKQADQLNADIREGKTGEQYTSSHFPDTPNYVAHMRLNERTDSQGNEGLFVEELQSDRHQAGREKGYREELVPEFELLRDGIFEDHFKTKEDAEYELKRREQIFPERKGKYSIQESNVFKTQAGIPDAPFRKDWSLQLFKRALRDAVDADKKWIGWTTGIEQVKRYEQAMRQSVDEISWNTPKGYQKAFAAIKDGNTVLAGKINEDGSVYDSDTADANGKQLSEVLGKEVASKILAENSGTATGDDLTVGGEGMKGFYDQILPKEIGKYVGKMGGRVEKSIINKDPLSDRPNTFYKNPETGEIEKMPQGNPIWRVDITPEMKRAVQGGQLQFMPAEQVDFDSNEVPIRKDWNEMLNQASKMSYDEFISLAKKGKLIQATGEPNPFKAGTGKSALSYGAGAGYSLKDIVHFYSEIIGPMEEAYNRFLDHAEYEKRAMRKLQFMPAEQVTKVPTQKELDEMKALLPKYTTEFKDFEENQKYISVYDENGNPAGFVDFSIDKNNNSLDVNWIETEIKNKGFGQALYRELAKYAQKQNIDTIKGAIIDEKAIKRREELFQTISKVKDPAKNKLLGFDEGAEFTELTSRVPSNTRFMPEQPTEYESISARIRPLEGIPAPTKMVGAKGLALGEVEPPVRGKAILPDMELKPAIGEKTETSSKIGKQISVQDAIQLVAGKTEKLGGVDPATWFDENDSLELRNVPLSEITPNQEGEKYDGTVNLERAKKYRKIPSDKMPPIILVEKKRNDDGLLNVLDGGHRVSAARMRGDDSILAIVRKQPVISEKGIQSSDKTGLQFMPSRPIRKTEPLPDFETTIIKGVTPVKGFKWDKATNVEIDIGGGRKMSFSYDPQYLEVPKFKDLIKELKGQPVILLEADRQRATGGDMGGPLHPFLKSNQVTITGPDGKKYKAVWANMTSTFVSGAKNRLASHGAKYALVHLMDPIAHKSNKRIARTLDRMMRKSKLSQREMEIISLSMQAGIIAGEKSAMSSAITALKRQMSSAKKDPEKIRIINEKINKITKEREDITPKGLYGEIFKAVSSIKKAISNVKTGNWAENSIEKANKKLEKYSNLKEYNELLKNNKSLYISDNIGNTFSDRGSAIGSILSFKFGKFDPSLVMRESSDFREGENLDIVTAVELSQNPDIFALYFGKDPKEEAAMSPAELKARDEMRANPDFVEHEAYDWVMLGPEKGNNFLVKNPVKPEQIFKKYRETHAGETVVDGSAETVAGAMRKNAGFILRVDEDTEKVLTAKKKNK